MTEKLIFVKDNVGIVEYTAAIQEIVKKFFDEDSNYTPHFGRINAVGVFFNYFVDADSLDAFFPDKDEIDFDFLLNNGYCMNLYNDALNDNGGFRLDFANAYKDAMEIVKTRISTIAGAIEQFREGIMTIIDKISPFFSEDTINKLSKISDDVASGNLSAESIVNAFGKSM